MSGRAECENCGHDLPGCPCSWPDEYVIEDADLPRLASEPFASVARKPRGDDYAAPASVVPRPDEEE